MKRELDMTKEKLKLTEITVIKKNEAIENVTKQFEKQREKTDLQRVMMEWKFKKLENEKEEFTIKIADKFYMQRLRTKYFLSWHLFTSTRHKLKLEKACKKKAEEVCYDLATKYETKIKRIDEELRVAKSEIDAYKEEMCKNEDYMKKALMRGVCALNMEAMSIFNDTIGNKTNSQTSSTNSIDMIDTVGKTATGQQKCVDDLIKAARNQVTYCPTKYLNEDAVETSGSSRSKSTSSEYLDDCDKRQNKELAKKVKNFCQRSMETKSMSAVSKGEIIKETSIYKKTF